MTAREITIAVKTENLEDAKKMASDLNDLLLQAKEIASQISELCALKPQFSKD